MNDPLGFGVHSAVLGMLSLSQNSAGVMPSYGAAPLVNSSHNGHMSQIDFGTNMHGANMHGTNMHSVPNLTSSFSQQQNNQNIGLPTPPGSPEESEKKQIEVASPVKTGDYNRSGALGQMCTNMGQQDVTNSREFSSNIQHSPDNLNVGGSPTETNSPFGFAPSTAGFAELPSTSNSALAASMHQQNPLTGMTASINTSSFAAPDFLDRNSVLAKALQTTSQSRRNSRSDKKPIPDERKDDKYFERRRRNNVAAKKSRDTRKNREDDVAMRAAYLERDNAVLRAQVATLREEAQSLRTLLLQKRQRQMQMQLCGSQQQPSMPMVN